MARQSISDRDGRSQRRLSNAELTPKQRAAVGRAAPSARRPSIRPSWRAISKLIGASILLLPTRN